MGRRLGVAAPNSLKLKNLHRDDPEGVQMV